MTIEAHSDSEIMAKHDVGNVLESLAHGSTWLWNVAIGRA